MFRHCIKLSENGIESNEDIVAVVDTGLALDHALFIGDEYLTYYALTNSSPYPTLQDTVSGKGFYQLVKVSDWGHALNDGANVVVFTDIGFGALADLLRKHGYAVFGTDAKSEMLESDRLYSRKILEKLDIPIPNADVVKGIEKLKQLIAQSNERRFIKPSFIRGEFETFGCDNLEELKIRLATPGIQLLGDSMTFVAEKELDGVEIGFDAFISKDGFLDTIFFTLEAKGCFDGDTEIFTNKGWIKFKDLKGDELIYTANLNTGEYKFTRPVEIIKYKYNGKMLRYNGKTLRFIVTPNHTFYTQPYHRHYYSTDDWKPKLAEEIVNDRYVIPKKMFWSGKDVEYFELEPAKECKAGRKPTNNDKKVINMETWLRFIAWFLSEGFVKNDKKGYYVYIVQTKENGKDAIEKILDVLPFDWKYYRKYYVINSKQLVSWLVENCYTSKDEKRAWTKKVPRFIKELSPRLLKIFIEEYAKGDGYYDISKDEIHLFTSSKQLADDLQEIALKAGYYARILTRYKTKIKSRFKANRDHYVVKIFSMRNNHEVFNLFPKNWEYIDWDDYVYCVNVEPYHTIYVRVNGVPFWSGNCGNATVAVDRDDNPWSDFLNKIEPWLVKNGYTGMFCAEGFYDGNKVVVTDITSRMPFISSHAYPRMINNFAEVVAEVAKGESPDIDLATERSLQIGLYTDVDTWNIVCSTDEFEEVRQFFGLRKGIMVNGYVFTVPGDCTLGAFVSLGNRMSRCFDRMVEYVDKISIPSTYVEPFEFWKYFTEQRDILSEYGFDF